MSGRLKTVNQLAMSKTKKKPAAKAEKAATRSRIVRAARELFWEKGYAATGMAEILSRADANAGSFYHFFKGKDDVLSAVLDEYLLMLDDQVMKPAFSRSTDPIERVFNVLAGYRRAILGTDFAFGCPLGRLAFELDPEDRLAHGKISQNFAAWRKRIAECIESAAPKLKRGIKPNDVSAFVLAVMEGGVIQSRSEKTIAPFDAAVKELRRYFDLIQS
jgi:AcrR family transcriptional regulator